jgi:hypothetical protein
MNSMDVRDDTIFSLLRAGRSRTDWWWLGLLVVVGWAGAVAYLGRYRSNQVSRVLEWVAPADVMFYGAAAVAGLLGIALAAAGRRALSGAALVIAAFVLGHVLYGWLYVRLDAQFRLPFRENAQAWRFAAARLAYAAALMAPMLAAWAVVLGRSPGWPPLRFGVGESARRQP